MDCDDVLLRLATPGHDRAALAGHLAGCRPCRELVDLEDRGDGSDDDQEDAAALIGRSIGPYRITEILGAGGMGVVYLAVHPEIESRVAIKVVSQKLSQDAHHVARFLAEARATNLIAHENIINVLDVGHLDDGRPYLVMEHLPGKPLSALIGTEQLTDALAQRVVLDVLSALTAAHARGIIHRDLKPDNIFVSPEGRATLLDFGIAKLRPDLARDVATASGALVGTPEYMAPEQALGDPVDARTDIYAIGLILYECLLGRRPFEGSSLYRLIDQQVKNTPPSPRAIRPELGEDLERVVLTALAKRPEDRFPDAPALHAALAACQVASDRGGFEVAAVAWARLTSEASTAIGTPRARARHGEPRAARPASRGRWIILVGAVAATVAIVLASRGGNEEATHAAGASLPAGASPAPAPADAPTAVTAIADAEPARPRVDPAGPPADAMPDSTVASATPGGARTPANRPRTGIDPRDLLDAATRLAVGEWPDAVLVRIQLRGRLDGGRVDRAEDYAIAFDYVSPERFAKGTTMCMLRVRYTAGGPQLQRPWPAKCGLAALAKPRCSLASVLSRATAGGALPAGTVSKAVLESDADSARPIWTLTVDGTEHRVVGC